MFKEFTSLMLDGGKISASAMIWLLLCVADMQMLARPEPLNHQRPSAPEAGWVADPLTQGIATGTSQQES
jgi:hypothetical protein